MKDWISLLNELLRIAAFIGLSFLLLKDYGMSIGLGIILYLFWVQLNEIKNTIKS